MLHLAHTKSSQPGIIGETGEKALYKSLTGSEDAYKKSVAGVGSPGTAFPACLKERVGFGTRQARAKASLAVPTALPAVPTIHSSPRELSLHN
jgi:hypothetical protein